MNILTCPACGKTHNRLGSDLYLCLSCYEIYNLIKIKYLNNSYENCLMCNKPLNRTGEFCIKCSRKLRISGSMQSYRPSMEGAL